MRFARAPREHLARDRRVRDRNDAHAGDEAAADALVEAAVEAGGNDNVTVVVLDVGAPGTAD